jgi:V/A-type H+-transporting ATPase subunit D
MEQVSPTRMNLMTKKSQIGLAVQGVDMMKKKRDALVKEFFDIVKELLAVRDKLDAASHLAYRSLMISKAIDGAFQLESAATAGRSYLEVDIEEKSIWGVKVPVVKPLDVRRSMITRGYSVTGVSSRIDCVADRFEDILNLILKIVSVEIRLKRLGKEIKKVTRRVNALEQILIPRLKGEVRYIKNALEERAREDTFRLKHIKKKSF